MIEYKYDLVTTDFGDGRLHGLWCAQKDARGTAIHVHGTWGNFYGNPFIAPLGTLYASLGINYLTANFPGHDETAIVERFDDFTGALDAWLAKYGPGPLILQGHSLGALKILRYMKDSRSKNHHRVACLILLSPFDVVAFYSCGNVDRIEERLRRIKVLIDKYGPQAHVPKDMFDSWLISLGTFMEIASPGAVSDQFPSRLSLEGTAIDKMKIPTFVGIGSEDFAAYPSPAMVHTKTTSFQNVHSVLIDKAPHNFEGKVDELVTNVQNWIRPILDRL